MVDATAPVDRIETRDDLGSGDEQIFAYWAGQEQIAEKEERKWVKRAREIVKRYRDERPDSTQGLARYNILWSNVQTLKPTLYGRTPKPDVERRFRDADPNARLASTLLERCLTYSVDAQDFDDVMRSVVEDRLLPGRGVARVLYIPHFGEEIPPEAKETEGKEAVASQEDTFEDEEQEGSDITNPGDEGEEKVREVVFEEVLADYLFWEDYREGPARKWREVPWVRYRSYLTRDELVKRFGKKKGEKVNLDYTPKGTPGHAKDEPPPDLFKKAIVHEYWDKSKKQAVWISPGTPDMVLDIKDDPLRLPNFFPNPDPLCATTTNDKRIPVPDYVEYQDQARELDRLTGRITKLTEALKVSGLYAGENKQELQQLVDAGTENKLIPVGDYQSFADKGGMKGIIEWMPIQQVAETLIQLYNARDRVKATLYEITGIGDIIRGETDPDETATAQELKSNFVTRRITPQQKEVAKFARDIFRLMAAVIAEHFSPDTISQITGYPQLDPVPPVPPQPQMPVPLMLAQANAALPQPGAPVPGAEGPAAPGAAPDPQLQQMAQAYQQAMQQWQQASAAAQQVMASNQQKQQQFMAAVQLIKQDGVHGFRIDIEADSTIAPDEAAEKRKRVEFMQGFVPLMEQMVPIAQGNPSMSKLAEEIVLFAVRGFQVARTLEETITKAFDALGQIPPAQKDGGAGPDSPADLAVRSKQIDATNEKTQSAERIANQKMMVDMAKLGQQSQTDAAKLAATEAEGRAKHVLEQAKLIDASNFRNKKAESMQAREAASLT